MIFIRKTSRLAEFRLHRSQTFGKSRNNFPASSTTLLFFFWMGFLEVKKMSSVTATRRWVKRPKQSPPKCLKGFCYLTGLRLEAKKLLKTDISNSVFISSSRWEAVNFPLERSRPIRSNQNKQCAVHHGKCQWVFNKSFRNKISKKKYIQNEITLLFHFLKVKKARLC